MNQETINDQIAKRIYKGQGNNMFVFIGKKTVIIYEMNFTLCALLVYNGVGVSALCTKCLHRPIVIINQQYTKGEIHFIYLHSFHVF